MTPTNSPIARFARFIDAQGRYGWGRVDFAPTGLEAAPHAGATVVPLQGDLFGEHRESGPAVPLASVRLLAPVVPGKAIGVASNYRDHAAEMGRSVPEHPRIFLMPPTAVVGPAAPIEIPATSERVDYEAELAVVIGRGMRDVPVDRALDHVLGYTAANDVTARDLQKLDGIFGRAKGFDSFLPLGPWIATGLDPSALAVRCRVNGTTRQDGNTADMVFGVAELLSFISGIMTLLPGDVVVTGTPAGVGQLSAGDVVEVDIEGIGVLANPVRHRVPGA